VNKGDAVEQSCVPLLSGLPEAVSSGEEATLDTVARFRFLVLDAVPLFSPLVAIAVIV